MSLQGTSGASVFPRKSDSAWGKWTLSINPWVQGINNFEFPGEPPATNKTTFNAHLHHSLLLHLF